MLRNSVQHIRPPSRVRCKPCRRRTRKRPWPWHSRSALKSPLWAPSLKLSVNRSEQLTAQAAGFPSVNRRLTINPLSRPRQSAHEGFCPSTHVLALVPTTPNPTSYGAFLYETCTFSGPFRQKTARNDGCGEPVFARADLKPTAAGRQNSAQMSPGISSPQKPRPFWPPGPRTGRKEPT